MSNHFTLQTETEAGVQVMDAPAVQPVNIPGTQSPAAGQSANGPAGDSRRETRPPQIKSLTVLRIFPAFLVVFFHSQHHFSFLSDAASAIAFPQAVTFFFVLSGFILAYNYWDLSGSANLIRFYFARIGRMWPAHAFTLILLVLFVPEVFRITREMIPIFFANLFLLHAWIPTWKSYFSFNAPAWSNSTEVSFYAFFPILLWCMRKRWWLPVLITGALTAAFVTYCTVNHLPECDPNGGLSEQALTFIFPLSRVIEFTVGMTAAMLLVRVRHINMNLIAGTLLEISAIAFVCYMNLSSSDARAALLPLVGSTAALWIQNCGMAIIAFYVLFLVFSLQRGAISKLFSMPLFVTLGEMSFGVYMLHSVLLAYRGINFPADQSINAYIMFWITLLVGAHLMWILVERPMRKVIIKIGDVLISRLKLISKGSEALLQPERRLSNPLKAKRGDQPLENARSDQAGLAPGRPKRQSKPLFKVLAAAEAAAFLALLYFSMPSLSKISSEDADSLLSGNSAQHADFAPYLKCVGATAARNGDVVSVKIVWEALQNQTVDYRANVTGFTADGAYLCQISYLLDPRRTRVDKGTLWVDSFNLPRSNSYSPDKIAFLTVEIGKGRCPLAPDKPLKVRVLQQPGSAKNLR